MPDTETGVDLHLKAILDLGHELKRQNDWRQKHAEMVFQQPINGQLSASGTLDGGQNANLQPDRGLCWSVRRLYADAFTAGTVKVFMNGIEPIALFSTAGAQYFGRGEIICQPGDRLVVVAAGITGAVQFWGVADAFPFWYLREYLD